MEDSSRWTTVRAICTRQKALWLVPGLIYAAFGAWRDEAPDSLQPPILADVLTWLPWWVGIIVALIIALVVLFEGAHREINAAKNSHVVAEGQTLKQTVKSSQVSGTVVQAQSISAERDVNIGAAEQKSEPAPRLIPATSDNGRCGFVVVENPGVAEKLSMKITHFEKDANTSIQAQWQAGVEDQLIKKGDQDWCLVMEVEPDRVPIIWTRGEARYPMIRKYDLERETDRRKRGVRTVRFFGKPANRDIEVKVAEEYSMVVTVFSHTRDPVTEIVSYGVATNETLVMPFDHTRFTHIEEERKKLLEKVMEPGRTPEIGTKEESQIESESDES